jgi:heme-degrading monooxygenase HmoA
MFAVIFEVNPRGERFDEYLDHAKRLRPELERIDGFIDNERFASKRRPGWLLSLSLWRDEKALIRWRTLAVHHLSQAAGRSGILADYHLRVGEVIADSGLAAGERLIEQRFDETETGAAKRIAIAERQFPEAEARTVAITAAAARLGLPASPEAAGVVDWDLSESILRPGKLLLLSAWRDAAAQVPMPADGETRQRRIRVIRDYGMYDRAEAPQYYPAASPARSAKSAR